MSFGLSLVIDNYLDKMGFCSSPINDDNDDDINEFWFKLASRIMYEMVQFGWIFGYDIMLGYL